MRQQSSVAVQTEKPNFNSLFVTPDEIDRFMKRAFDRVAQRAFELFQKRGGEHGRDMEDWNQAESEIFQSISIELGDPGDAYIAVADVSGYRPEDLKISAGPRSLTLCGWSSNEGAESAEAEGDPQRSERFFFSFPLPMEIDSSAVSADIRHDVLEIRLPKILPDSDFGE